MPGELIEQQRPMEKIKDLETAIQHLRDGWSYISDATVRARKFKEQAASLPESENLKRASRIAQRQAEDDPGHGAFIEFWKDSIDEEMKPDILQQLDQLREKELVEFLKNL